MLNDGQIWKNGSKIAKIELEEETYRAVIFNTDADKLVFSKMIPVNEDYLYKSGFKPSTGILTTIERN